MTQQTPDSSENSVPLIPALIFFGGLTLILLALFAGRPSTRVGVELAAVPTVVPTAAPTVLPTAVSAGGAQPVAEPIDPARVSRGETSFSTICTACHGFNAMGIVGLGKTLIGSEFVNGLTNDELVAFIAKGRDVSDPLNTTGVVMPARGGNPILTDDDLMNVVHYIRNLNAGAAAVAAARPTAAPTATLDPNATLAPTATAISLSSLIPTSAADTSSSAASSAPLVPGKAAYDRQCASCHAADGNGVPGLAKPLSESALLRDRTAVVQLFDFLSKPQPVAAGALPHPIRGGYPELTDAEIYEVITYMNVLLQ